MKKIGKIGKRNLEANRILKEIYIDRGIARCELRMQGCWGDNALGFAHKEKRWKYIKNPEGLSDFNQTLLACTPCHQKIEVNRELTLYYFNKLRP